MEGSGLSYIMKRAIEYHKNHPDNFRVSAYQPPTTYNDRSKEHRNVVFTDTLEVIENVILFSISNYFLRFSNEYKRFTTLPSLIITGMIMLNLERLIC